EISIFLLKTSFSTAWILQDFSIGDREGRSPGVSFRQEAGISLFENGCGRVRMWSRAPFVTSMQT
ncbi:hypothetical protein, partial [Paenibacillus dendritiformis]